MDHQKIYNLIIQRAKFENRVKLPKTNKNYVYYEKHHIIPYCLSKLNSKENLVLLTGREHFICHKLLTYIYPHNRQIALAFHKMSFSSNSKNYKVSSKDYEYARYLISITPISKETKRKISISGKHRYLVKGCSDETKKKLSKALKGRIAPNKGKKMSEEQKNKLSLSHKNRSRIITEETRKKMSESAKKKPNVTIETRKKMSEKRKGKLNPMAGKYGKDNPNFGSKRSNITKEKMRKPKQKIKCPYCNKIGGIPIMYRFHFDNCKYQIVD